MKLEVKEIVELSDLSTVAADMGGMFVFLPGRDETTAKAPTALMQGAARKIESQLRGGKIGIFTLKAGSSDYEQVASQVPVPSVFAMVMGRGIGVASGGLTENKLLRAYATASKTAGCGCGGGGCCG